MANTVNDKQFSKSGQAAQARELWGEDSSSLVCPKCQAKKVAISRPQAGDQLRAMVWPAMPYRCLRCYHRFWLKEKFFSNSLRIGFWALVLVVLLLLAARALMPLLGQAGTNVGLVEEPIEVLIPQATIDAADASVIGLEEPLVVVAPGGFEPTAVTENDGDTLDVVDINFPESSIGAQVALTAEQQKEQVKLAKQRSEMAAQQSQARLEQVESSLAPDPLERESLAKVEVGYVVEQWRESWASGDVQNYLRQYSPSFKPSKGLSLDEWEAQRLARVVPSKKISLVLSGFDMTFSDQMTKAYVEFDQGYTAGGYSDTSKKQLILTKSSNGWKIVSETELEQ